MLSHSSFKAKNTLDNHCYHRDNDRRRKKVMYCISIDTTLIKRKEILVSGAKYKEIDNFCWGSLICNVLCGGVMNELVSGVSWDVDKQSRRNA
jgi:hypothetical protein